MNNPQKAIGVILTVALLLAAAAIVFMRACLKPSPVSHPSPITKTIPAPTPRACCDSLGLPYTQTPSPTPSHEPAIVPGASMDQKLSDVIKKPSKSDSTSQKPQQNARTSSEADVAWHYSGETLIIGTKNDGETIYWTLSAGMKAIRSSLEISDCHSYPERFVPCRVGPFMISFCQKEVSGPPPNGSAFIARHHERDLSCDYDRDRNQ